MPVHATTPCMAAAMLVALASCGSGAPSTPPAPSASAAPADAATVQAGEAPAAAEAAALQGDLVVSTNEPFWNASLGGQALTLRGLEGERHLAIDSSDLRGGTRRVRASDAGGAVELEVVAEGCQDSMSGASFPFSATVSIDGGAPVRGCARPASMPPPGEPR